MEVGGALLPALSPQEQRQVRVLDVPAQHPATAHLCTVQVLLAAEQQFDLLECVLVRVEELLDQPLPPPPSQPTPTSPPPD